jgi:hypothetical protein
MSDTAYTAEVAELLRQLHAFGGALKEGGDALNKRTVLLEQLRHLLGLKTGTTPVHLAYEDLIAMGISPKEAIRLLYCFGHDTPDGGFGVHEDELDDARRQLQEEDAKSPAGKQWGCQPMRFGAIRTEDTKL